MKVVHHINLHNISKERIFPTSFTRKLRKDRKVRISVEVDIQKVLILLPDNLWIKCFRIKKELSNLVQK